MRRLLLGLLGLVGALLLVGCSMPTHDSFWETSDYGVDHRPVDHDDLKPRDR